jgi:triosephosphate isomerase (TIM)
MKKAYKNYLFIANWKMELSHNQALAWCDCYGALLEELIRSNEITFVLCPEFTVLSQVKKALSPALALGAQNCAAHECGAYTGEVAAQSLAQLGCTYCIVGHNERRRLYGETNADVACKVALLVKHGITPIACIGDAQAELESILEGFTRAYDLSARQKSESRPDLVIAYEPEWAIGTGKVPGRNDLIEYARAMRRVIHTYIPRYAPDADIRLCYGGSVTTESMQELKQVDELDGFLIGRASLDFQMLKKIVVL